MNWFNLSLSFSMSIVLSCLHLTYLFISFGLQRKQSSSIPIWSGSIDDGGLYIHLYIYIYVSMWFNHHCEIRFINRFLSFIVRNIFQFHAFLLSFCLNFSWQKWSITKVKHWTKRCWNAPKINQNWIILFCI